MNAPTPLAALLSQAPAWPLDQQPLGRAAWVVRIIAPAHAPEWVERLADLGFLPGERVMITARGRPGGDPLAVRIGTSTFALRRAEAACIVVTADPT